MTALSPVTTMFVAILVTFVCTRLITRRIRSRETPGGAFNNVSIGGVHIHHQFSASSPCSGPEWR